MIAFYIIGFRVPLYRSSRICHSSFNKRKIWGHCMAAMCGVVIHFSRSVISFRNLNKNSEIRLDLLGIRSLPKYFHLLGC